MRDGVEQLGKNHVVTGDAVWAVSEHNGELWLGSNAGLFIGKPGICGLGNGTDFAVAVTAWAGGDVTSSTPVPVFANLFRRRRT